MRQRRRADRSRSRDLSVQRSASMCPPHSVYGQECPSPQTPEKSSQQDRLKLNDDCLCACWPCWCMVHCYFSKLISAFVVMLT
mmetsp:Transcript_97653/g.187223  ORF Transcript_97653/g.187223 Transcript_97653/m.187223 type:complete len:83 (+) Transcript_97653:347-595(+)